MPRSASQLERERIAGRDGKMTKTTHRCPIEPCPRDVPSHQLMCPGHWRTVPTELKRELYSAWKGGRGALSDRHAAAMLACIETAREAAV